MRGQHEHRVYYTKQLCQHVADLGVFEFGGVMAIIGEMTEAIEGYMPIGFFPVPTDLAAKDTYRLLKAKILSEESLRTALPVLRSWGVWHPHNNDKERIAALRAAMQTVFDSIEKEE